MNTTSPISRLVMALALATLAGAAGAQTAASTVQRDVNQETRIRDGLQNGQLTTREAAVLQREEARVDHLQAQALKDGQLSAAERARLQQAQNQVSQDIATARHNGVNGNPNSASSRRMQQAVQRDINQQQRIENGIQQGQLSNQEVAKLERGQARDGRQQFRAGRDGRVGAAESGRINRAEDRQSARIYRKRHNGVNRG